MAHADKVKLPKSVAGFKIPKAWRKSELVEALASSPAGRQRLADALLAAGAAAAASLTAETGSDDDDAATPGPAVDVRSTATQAAALLSILTSAAAEAIRPALPIVPDPAPEEPVATPARRSRARPVKRAAAPALDDASRTADAASEP